MGSGGIEPPKIKNKKLITRLLIKRFPALPKVVAAPWLEHGPPAHGAGEFPFLYGAAAKVIKPLQTFCAVINPRKFPVSIQQDG